MTAKLPPARLKSKSRLLCSFRAANLTRLHALRPTGAHTRNTACSAARPVAAPVCVAPFVRSVRARPLPGRARITFSFH